MYHLQPCRKFVKENSAGQQVKHILEEISEAIEAYIQGDKDHSVEEFIDAQSAIETMLQLMGVGPIERMMARAKVNEKNLKRGYWK